MGFLFLSLFFFVGAVSATNLTVTPSDSIQSKIDGASSGDTLNLATGNYYQYNIKVNKSLTIAGPTTTGTPIAVIDAQNQGRVFNITEGTNVILKYLTITNGNATKDTYNPYGGGILNQGNCTIIGCRINTNTADSGGGIYNHYGNCAVSGSNINSNGAINNGGGIFSYGNCALSGSNVNGNTANFAGGIFNGYNDCAVSGSNINRNKALVSGGGIYNVGDCTVTSSSINSNTAISGGGIYNFGTCTVTGSNVNSNTANGGGGIYNYVGTCVVTSSDVNNNFATYDGGGINTVQGNCTVTGSKINSNTATTDGGGICNIHGDCNLNGSNINFNSAVNGGGICNTKGSVMNVTGSSIKNNKATNDGGGVYNFQSDLTINGTTIKYNTASFGGGLLIRDTGTVTITGCDIESNKANTYGNAIYNDNGDISTRILHFNRFYDTSTGYEIYCASGIVDAMFNWWGSNDNPDSKVYGDVDTSPWLVLKLAASPTLIGTTVNSNITADLRYDSIDGYHNPTNGYFPNSIPVKFSTTLGSITSPTSTSNGTAKATLTSGSTSGVADVFASLDDEIVGTNVNIDTIPPTITTIDPVNNAVNVARDKVIKVTFSEPVKAGNMWIELYNAVGTKALIPITTSISGNVLTINHAALLANGTKYILAFHTGSVTDLAGNSLAGVARYFTTSTDGTAPTITSTDPTNNAVNVPRNKVITVTFSEPVKAGNMWIELYNAVGTKTLIPISTSISGNVLTINHAALLATGIKYALCLHTGSITDAAGNPVASAVRYFTTGNT